MKVQKFTYGCLDKNFIYTVNPMETFLGKVESCEMTALSGTLNKRCYNGNTISFKMSGECDKKRYLYISGNTICSFLTDDNLYKYVPNMGDNLIPNIMAIGEKNNCFLTPYFKIIRKKVIDGDKLSKTDEDTVDLFDYLVSNCEKDTFRKIQLYKIVSNFD